MESWGFALVISVGNRGFGGFEGVGWCALLGVRGGGERVRQGLFGKRGSGVGRVVVGREMAVLSRGSEVGRK